jgi:RNA polymerase sigma factor (sigma-70 family)
VTTQPAAIGRATIMQQPATPVAVVRVEPFASFDDFYAQHLRTLANALAMTLHDRDLASQAIDEAMVRAYASWSKVQRMDNPAGWVYRVALNWARSVLRRLTGPRRMMHERDSVELAARDHELHHALATLDVDRRAVVVCRYFLGMSEAQICAALGLRPGTVKSRLHRALSDLEAQLARIGRTTSGSAGVRTVAANRTKPHDTRIPAATDASTTAANHTTTNDDNRR